MADFYIDVKEELVTRLRPLLKDYGYPNVRVLKGDPRTPAEIPCICINRAGDDESNQVLGEDIASDFNEQLNKWVELRGTFFHETIEIRVWHTNSDERDKLYSLTKVLLFKLRNDLVELGLRNIVLRGGRDEQDNTFPPHPIYWGAINMSYLNPVEVEVLYDSVEGIDVVGYLSSRFSTELPLSEGGEIDVEEGS